MSRPIFSGQRRAEAWRQWQHSPPALSPEHAAWSQLVQALKASRSCSDALDFEFWDALAPSKPTLGQLLADPQYTFAWESQLLLTPSADAPGTVRPQWRTLCGEIAGFYRAMDLRWQRVEAALSLGAPTPTAPTATDLQNLCQLGDLCHLLKVCCQHHLLSLLAARAAGGAFLGEVWPRSILSPTGAATPALGEALAQGGIDPGTFDALFANANDPSHTLWTLEHHRQQVDQRLAQAAEPPVPAHRLAVNDPQPRPWIEMNLLGPNDQELFSEATMDIARRGANRESSLSLARESLGYLIPQGGQRDGGDLLDDNRTVNSAADVYAVATDWRNFLWERLTERVLERIPLYGTLSRAIRQPLNALQQFVIRQRQGEIAAFGEGRVPWATVMSVVCALLTSFMVTYAAIGLEDADLIEIFALPFLVSLGFLLAMALHYGGWVGRLILWGGTGLFIAFWVERYVEHPGDRPLSALPSQVQLLPPDTPEARLINHLAQRLEAMTHYHQRQGRLPSPTVDGDFFGGSAHVGDGPQSRMTLLDRYVVSAGHEGTVSVLVRAERPMGITLEPQIGADGAPTWCYRAPALDDGFLGRELRRLAEPCRG
ncbi:MAG: hypothetical protein ACFCBW_21995 [Candidatus Competibacterales bacterium]